ncbi:bifunctional inhibitor/lipid-transfer protein/seed storage 2s albumin superfamily protein family [Trichomonas vaginalis G3]|uniref:bifunctional inhibitor/lipid-transfer protein/seed storage 2s albumin superfamily protein family n=1 Tax=Trichomonas vaginalis (strain ATCC PRA-98 / G3) TaxID=412133 RepID=UPI0021E5EA35|nr:bifunctional inhibitor/lipid-transfer protein/seed storage 2s albumin superfamily protein family [Trichomonas vaginalis G3]KAI5511996.1 bifunctional inhibitor/lipid-transfer protein/seed storage 2s albumin superfamily protein family [Trichomonas vaginalis G3]
MKLYFSSIAISNGAYFSNNYAFGTGVAAGSGGAIFISYSTLTSTGTSQITFYQNEAGLGGAFCALASPVLLNNIYFNDNKAYKFGGALYYQGALKQGAADLDSAHVLILKEVIFRNNDGVEYGGAICFSSAADAYFDGCTIESNTASFAGAGLYSFNSDVVKIFNTKFISNKLSPKKFRQSDGTVPKINNNFVLDLNKYNPRFRSRGGGAICFVSDNKKGILPSMQTTSNKKRFINTMKCCFKSNTAGSYATSFGGGPGHDVVLDGFVHYISMEDAIQGYTETNKNLFISHTCKSWNTDTATSLELSLFGMNQKYQMETICSITTDSRSSTDAESSVKFTTGVRNGDGTSRVSSPTPYSYPRTPITRLPHATTKSTSRMPPSKRIDFTLKTLSVKQTYPATPYKTVHSTPHSTAHKTPFSTAHKTPHKTPFSTVHSTPHSTAHKTPFSTAHKTPFVTVFKTPFSTAHSTPHSTFNKVRYSAFDISLHSAFHPSFHCSFYSSLYSTFDSAFNTSFHSTLNSAFDSSFDTSFDTTFNTTFNCSLHSSFYSTFNTSFYTSFDSTFHTTLNTNLHYFSFKINRSSNQCKKC